MEGKMTDTPAQPQHLDALIQVRAPQQLILSIKRAASAKGQTASAYVRAHEDGLRHCEARLAFAS
jgi:predicted DNA binding CopG/RHH family protein